MLILTSFVSIVAADENYGPMANNALYFGNSPKDVVVGQTFRFDIWVDVNWAIDTLTPWNMTYLPAGKVNSTGAFTRGLVFMTAYHDGEDSFTDSNKAAHNDAGWRLMPTWAVNPGYEVNNSDTSAVNCTWYARRPGTVTVTMVSDLAGDPLTARGGTDYGTNLLTGTIRVHPQNLTGSLTAVKINSTKIHLYWTKPAGIDKVTIRYKAGSYPTSVTDGTLLVNSTGTSTDQTGLSPGQTVYYRAWGWNSTGSIYTLGYLSTTGTTNQLPTIASPSPTNGTIGQPGSFTWSVTVGDPDGASGVTWTIQCNNSQTNSGSGIGSKTLSLSGLALLHWYKVWVNVSDGNDTTRRWYNFRTADNSPPTFGTPSPTNLSSGNSRALTWQIPINDPNGNTFSWTIQCNNGQTNSGTGATNGTKSLSLSGLAYSTTYKVWVNATDPGGSGLYTRRWYQFTTLANTAPSQGTPSPTNGTTGRPFSFTWSIPLSDLNGDLLSWTIQCNNTQQSSGSGQTNGTKSLSLSGLTKLHWYKVWVNVTDGTVYTRRWYNFQTMDNAAPVFDTPTPANNSINQNLAFTWQIGMTDAELDTISWTVQCSNGQSSSGSGGGIALGSLSLTGLSFSTTYKVYVNATDAGSGSYTRRWYQFTTKDNSPPNAPTNMNPDVDESDVDPEIGNLRLLVSDPDGQTLTVRFYSGNGTLIGTDIVASGQYADMAILGLLENTNYTWYVNITDGFGGYRRGPATGNWTFTTGTFKRGGGGGGLPSGGGPIVPQEFPSGGGTGFEFPWWLFWVALMVCLLILFLLLRQREKKPWYRK